MKGGKRTRKGRTGESSVDGTKRGAEEEREEEESKTERKYMKEVEKGKVGTVGEAGSGSHHVSGRDGRRWGKQKHMYKNKKNKSTIK